jgi:hypothetical protein
MILPIISDGNKRNTIEKYNRLISEEKNYFKKIILIFRKELDLRRMKESKSVY